MMWIVTFQDKVDRLQRMISRFGSFFDKPNVHWLVELVFQTIFGHVCVN